MITERLIRVLGVATVLIWCLVILLVAIRGLL